LKRKIFFEKIGILPSLFSGIFPTRNHFDRKISGAGPPELYVVSGDIVERCSAGFQPNRLPTPQKISPKSASIPYSSCPPP
jgi:hypothetical protein